MDELSRQEIENLDRFVSVSNMPPPQMIERLCETALAALDRADNLVFDLKMLKDSAYLIKRAEEAERNDTQSPGLYRQARLRAEKAERELAAVKDQVAALWQYITPTQRQFDRRLDDISTAAVAWRTSVQDEALESVAELVEDEGPCRRVDHVQGLCACAKKAAMIRAVKGGTPS